MTRSRRFILLSEESMLRLRFQMGSLGTARLEGDGNWHLIAIRCATVGAA